MEPAAPRLYFETNSPLGTMKGLTYFAMLISKMCQHIEKHVIAELKNTVALAAVFCYQAAIDSGRFQLAWLFTGRSIPALNLAMRNTARLADEPFSLLADPRWVVANRSCLKDMDYFEVRQKALGQIQECPRTPKTRNQSPKRSLRTRR